MLLRSTRNPDSGLWSEGRRLDRAVGVLRIRDYRRWFFAQTFSASGSMAQVVGQAWLALRLTGRGLDLGLLAAATFFPLLVASPWCGSLVDRHDRRRVLQLTQSLLMAFSILLAILTLAGVVQIWTLFVVALCTGAVNAVDTPARQIYAIELVGLDRTANAISLNEVVINLSRVLGPALAGVLLATEGVAACFIFNAVSFVPPLVVLVLRGRTHDKVVNLPPRGSVKTMDGIRYALSSPIIRKSLLISVGAGMVFNFGVILPLAATRVFHTGSRGYALMMVLFGSGAVIGALLATAGGSAIPSFVKVRVLAILTGCAVLATSQMPFFPLALVGQFLIGGLSIWYVALANSLVQMRSKPQMRGRVMALWGMVLVGSITLTGPLMGWIAQGIGVRESWALPGLTLIATASYGRWHWGSNAKPSLNLSQ